MSAALRSYHAFISKDHLTSFKLCEELRQRGSVGNLAAELFRWLRVHTGKQDWDNSTVERRDKKIACYVLVVQRLSDLPTGHGIAWGFKPATRHLMVDLPTVGQIRLPVPLKHSLMKIYRKRWDGKKVNDVRILGFCESVLDGCFVQPEGKGETKWTPATAGVEHSSDQAPAASPNP